MTGIKISVSALSTAVTTLDPSKPVTMLNLIRFHEVPQCTPDLEVPSVDTTKPQISGREAYMTRYIPAWESVILKYGGGEVKFVSTTVLDMLRGLEETSSSTSESWDLVALVEYKSVQAFRDMVEDKEYLMTAEPHRLAAIKDWALLACR